MKEIITALLIVVSIITFSTGCSKQATNNSSTLSNSITTSSENQSRVLNNTEQKLETTEINPKVIEFLNKYPDLKNKYDDAQNILDKCMEQYPDLTDEQYQELLEVKVNDDWIKFPYKEATIVGIIENSSQRMTLDDVQKVISENSGSSVDDIVKKLSKIQLPDEVGGSGTTTVQFFLDDDGNTRIIAAYSGFGRNRQILYYHSDEYETLYVEKTSSLDFLGN